MEVFGGESKAILAAVQKPTYLAYSIKGIYF
jgi:hypothetical protein